MVSLDLNAALGFIDDDVYKKAREDAFKAFDVLHDAKGAGNDFLGWLDLPSRVDEKLIDRIEAVARRWKTAVHRHQFLR